MEVFWDEFNFSNTNEADSFSFIEKFHLKKIPSIDKNFIILISDKVL
jgi:hypothetical protein